MYRRCGFRYEKKLRATGIIRIAGIDEAGRGALAGPVVAAAVVLPEKFRHRKLNDSKQLAPERRELIYDELVSNADITWAVGIVDHIQIDRINILRASLESMRIAQAARGARREVGRSVFAESRLQDSLPQFPRSDRRRDRHRLPRRGHPRFCRGEDPRERRIWPAGRSGRSTKANAGVEGRPCLAAHA